MTKPDFTLHELQCFDAVVRLGGFQQAAASLHRSHPAVFAAVAKLEHQLDFVLLDRTGYRVRLTEQGLSFHRRAQQLLREFEGLRSHAAHLGIGEESELHVVIGDMCPIPQSLGLLGQFFSTCPNTRLHLHFEAVGGPWERLVDGEADLIFHWIDKRDPRTEWIDVGEVRFIPVMASASMEGRTAQSIEQDLFKTFTQCVMRDTVRHSAKKDYFMLEGAPRCMVADQGMKKEFILQGLGWGHLPHFLIEEELSNGRLRSISGTELPGSIEELVVARRSDRGHGPVANKLWDYLQLEVPKLRLAVNSEKRPKAKRSARSS